MAAWWIVGSIIIPKGRVSHVFLSVIELELQHEEILASKMGTYFVHLGFGQVFVLRRVAEIRFTEIYYMRVSANYQYEALRFKIGTCEWNGNVLITSKRYDATAKIK